LVNALMILTWASSGSVLRFGFFGCVHGFPAAVDSAGSSTDLPPCRYESHKGWVEQINNLS
jgi:hypothetical protein